MGVSACVVVLLLSSVGWLASLTAGISNTDREGSDVLSVRVKEDTSERLPDSTTGNDKDLPSVPHEPVTSTEHPAIALEGAPEDLSEAPGESLSTKDWYTIADEVAKASIDGYFRQEESRASRWWRSPSVMFEPVEEFALKSEEPVLADLRFVPEIHVLGLGLTIGSCFFGVPIAGVPVEQRNAAITLFVCAEGS